MNDILELVIEFIWQAIKIVLYLFIWNIVIFNLGRIFLLIITLGAFPRNRHLENNVNLIDFAGLFVLLASWTLIALYNNWGNIVGNAT